MNLKIDELNFDYAHYLPKKYGKCHNLHGHCGIIKNLTITTKEDMIVDFNIIKKVIDSEFDHCLFLPDTDLLFWQKAFEMLKGICNFKLKVMNEAEATFIERIAEEVKACLEGIEGIIEVHFELYEGKNQGVIM